jgi:hypothetical protein
MDFSTTTSKRHGIGDFKSSAQKIACTVPIAGVEPGSPLKIFPELMVAGWVAAQNASYALAVHAKESGTSHRIALHPPL